MSSFDILIKKMVRCWKLNDASTTCRIWKRRFLKILRRGTICRSLGKNQRVQSSFESHWTSRSPQAWGPMGICGCNASLKEEAQSKNFVEQRQQQIDPIITRKSVVKPMQVGQNIASAWTSRFIHLFDFIYTCPSSHFNFENESLG